MLDNLAVLILATSALAAPQLDLQNGNIPQPTAANTAPQQQENDGANYASGSPVTIISQTYEVGENGTYNFSFESSDGTKREESGYLKYNVPPPPEGVPEDYDGTAQVAQGSYSYIGPDGTQYTLKYIADENGFRVEGDHLPKVATGTGVGSSQGNTNLGGGSQPTQTPNANGQGSQINQGNGQDVSQVNGLDLGNGFDQSSDQNQGNRGASENKLSEGTNSGLGGGSNQGNIQSDVSSQGQANGLDQGNGNVAQGSDFSYDNASGGVEDQGTGEPSPAIVSPTQLTAGLPAQQPTITPTQVTTGLTEII